MTAATQGGGTARSRLSRADLSDLKDKVAELGMPYQTLVSAVLHQYVTGRLIGSAATGVL
jgi:hypothetical protein